MLMKRRGFFLTYVFLSLCTALFSQAMEPLESQREATAQLQAESVSEIANTSTSITIRSSAGDAEVFLNGNYEGMTTLTLKNLPAGRYHLRVQKIGYETRHFVIIVRAGQSQEFYVELKRRTGAVYFRTDPTGATILVDGTICNENPAQIDEGTHIVQAECFGFTKQSQQIFVPAYSVQTVNFSLESAPFSLSRFSASKKEFNPALPGNIGRITFSFYVTNHGTGNLSIYNDDDEEILRADYGDFSTWRQQFVWNGTDFSGEIVPDGIYTAIITAGEDAQSLSLTFAIDSSIHIPHAMITSGGTGIGSLPAAFLFPKKSGAFTLSGGIDFQSEGRAFYAVPVEAALLYTPLSWLECAARIGLLAGASGAEKTPLQFGASIKFGWNKPLRNSQIDFALFGKIGGSTQAVFTPYGADTGTGLGGGIAFGLQTASFYAGITSEVTAGTLYGISAHNDVVWKNGLSLQKTFSAFSAGIYGAVHSSFGHTEKDEDLRDENYWLRAAEWGLDGQIQIAGTPVSINLKVYCVDYIKEICYICTKAGFQILF